MKAGKFITLEGGEGTGKSTNLPFVQQLLVDHNIDVISTREPGGTVLAEKIRQLLLDQNSESMSKQAELLLVFAARAQHIQQLIQPALEQGKWVLCDRFTDATYAYQGGGRNIDTGFIAYLEAKIQGTLRPDLTLLLDTTVAVSAERAGKRTQRDRFETETQHFFAQVRAAYLQRAHDHPQQIKLIDAGQPLPQVQADISRLVQDFLGASDG